MFRLEKSGSGSHVDAVQGKSTYIALCFLLLNTSLLDAKPKPVQQVPASELLSFDFDDKPKPATQSSSAPSSDLPILISEKFWEYAFSNMSDSMTIQLFRKICAFGLALQEKIMATYMPFFVQKLENYTQPIPTHGTPITHLRQLTTMIKQLPPTLEIVKAVIKKRDNCALRIFKKALSEVANDLAEIQPSFRKLVDQNTLEAEKKAHKDQALSTISMTIKQYKNNMHSEDGVITSMLLHYSTTFYKDFKFSRQILTKLSPEVLKNVLNLNKHFDLHTLPMVIRTVKTDEHLEVLFDFVVQKMQERLKPVDKNTIVYSSMSILAESFSELIPKALQTPGMIKGSNITTAEKKNVILDFNNLLFELLYKKIDSNGCSPHDVDAFLKFSYYILQYLPSDDGSHAKLTSWNRFIIYVAKFLTDIRSVDKRYKLSREVKVDQLLISVFKRSFFNLKKQDSLGNQIPYIYEEHLAIIRNITIELAKLYPTLAYDPVLNAEVQLDRLVPPLIVLLSLVRPTELLFQNLWGVMFDMFASVAEDNVFDELQLDLVKLLTKMLCTFVRVIKLLTCLEITNASPFGLAQEQIWCLLFQEPSIKFIT